MISLFFPVAAAFLTLLKNYARSMTPIGAILRTIILAAYTLTTLIIFLHFYNRRLKAQILKQLTEENFFNQNYEVQELIYNLMKIHGEAIADIAFVDRNDELFGESGRYYLLAKKVLKREHSEARIGIWGNVENVELATPNFYILTKKSGMK